MENIPTIIKMSADDAAGVIYYDRASTAWGDIVIASSRLGICFIGFTDTLERAVTLVKERFPNATLCRRSTEFHRDAIAIISDNDSPRSVPLHMLGTDFQHDVWRAITSILQGATATYSKIASLSGHPTAIRAVATAIGHNPVSILVPCHRVVPADGTVGGYHWGQDIKRHLLAAEGVYLTDNIKSTIS